MVGRTNDGSATWMSQRDQTPNLSEFENMAFRETRRVFCHILHMFATVDDDLFGTRAADNQVKMLSARKADREGHSADAVADALSRVVMALRFRRRGESQVESVGKLLSTLLDGKGQEALNSCVVTADRGYGKESFLNLFTSFGLAAVFVMPDHILRCHPFVASSLLDPLRDDYEVDDADLDEQSPTVGESDAGLSNVSVLDRRDSFVIDDNARMGQAFFTASKPLRTSGTVGQRRVTAVAVREHGTKKYSRLLRFMHSVPSGVSKEFDRWIAVPKAPVSVSRTLFAGNDNPGSKCCETALLQHCFPLTVGQRCADWFTLRQFRVTGTNSCLILQQDPGFRAQVGLPSQPVGRERTLGDWFVVLMDSWFSEKVSTEPMMRGSANEGPVIAHLRTMAFVRDVYEVGMLELSQHQELACSPDGVALLDSNPSVSSHLEGDGDLEVDGNRVWIAPVEVKTRVSPNTLGTSIVLTSAEALFCDLGDEVCHKYVATEHLAQVVQQVTVLGAQFAVYIMASETGVLYTVVMRVSDAMKVVCLETLKRVSDPVVTWAQMADGSIPYFAPRGCFDILRSRWSFWKVVNEHVKANGPFRPLKLFKHAIQSFYSKTKGGVDGATQQRAILRSATSHLQWEQKLVSQVLKTVSINAFIAWRIFERRDLLQNLGEFKSLERYRNALNKVQSTADFMLDSALDLLAHAQSIGAANSPHKKSVDSVGMEETRALIVLAAGRKRRRILFFNSDKGVKLRLSVTGHIPTKNAHLYCVLCGQNTGSDGKGWRGHRTNIKCNICSVNLCIQIYAGLRKSCWSLWHSSKELAHRNTPQSLKGTEGTQDTSKSPEQAGSDDEYDDLVDAEMEVEVAHTPTPTRSSVRLRSQDNTTVDPEL